MSVSSFGELLDLCVNQVALTRIGLQERVIAPTLTVPPAKAKPSINVPFEQFRLGYLMAVMSDAFFLMHTDDYGMASQDTLSPGEIKMSVEALADLLAKAAQSQDPKAEYKIKVERVSAT